MTAHPSRPTPDAIREALIRTALDAYEDAGIRGLCAEGRWEVALDAMRSLDVGAISQTAMEGGGGGEEKIAEGDGG